MTILDDPFNNYPHLIKEREKLRRIEEFKEGKHTRGGYRPGAGAPKKTQKVFKCSFLINKSAEQELLSKINELKENYAISNINVSSNNYSS